MEEINRLISFYEIERKIHFLIEKVNFSLSNRYKVVVQDNTNA